MEINFGPKKVWNDLKESKESLKYLLYIGLLLIVLCIVDVVVKAKIFSSISSLILGSYFVLMINNIIHDKKPILEDFSASKEEKRKFSSIILKSIGIGVVYGLAIFMIGLISFFIFSKALMLNMTLSITLLIILLLPLIILMFLSNFLFAENLNFGDAFNIKRAFESFKIAWGEYLTVFGINILLAILLFILLMVILVPVSMSMIFLLKSYPAFVVTKETANLISGILGAVFGQIGVIIITYWYSNAAAQVYKYSITKMNITED